MFISPIRAILKAEGGMKKSKVEMNKFRI